MVSSSLVFAFRPPNLTGGLGTFARWAHVFEVPWDTRFYLGTKPNGTKPNAVVSVITSCQHFQLACLCCSTAGKYGFAERIIDGMYVSINSVVVNFKAPAFTASIQVSPVLHILLVFAALVVVVRRPECGGTPSTQFSEARPGQTLPDARFVCACVLVCPSQSAHSILNDLVGTTILRTSVWVSPGGRGLSAQASVPISRTCATVW